MLKLPGATLTAIAGAAVIVICAAAVFAGFASAAASIVTKAGVGTRSGALYSPLLIVPTVEFPPTIPLTSQITLVSVAFFTVALNCTLPDVVTDVLLTCNSIVTLEVGVLGGSSGELAHPTRNNSSIAAIAAAP
jgi:hypothetical protein